MGTHARSRFGLIVAVFFLFSLFAPLVPASLAQSGTPVGEAVADDSAQEEPKSTEPPMVTDPPLSAVYQTEGEEEGPDGPDGSFAATIDHAFNCDTREIDFSWSSSNPFIILILFDGDGFDTEAGGMVYSGQVPASGSASLAHPYNSEGIPGGIRIYAGSDSSTVTLHSHSFVDCASEESSSPGATETMEPDIDPPSPTPDDDPLDVTISNTSFNCADVSVSLTWTSNRPYHLSIQFPYSGVKGLAFSGQVASVGDGTYSDSYNTLGTIPIAVYIYVGDEEETTEYHSTIPVDCTTNDTVTPDAATETPTEVVPTEGPGSDNTMTIDAVSCVDGIITVDYSWSADPDLWIEFTVLVDHQIMGIKSIGKVHGQDSSQVSIEPHYLNGNIELSALSYYFTDDDSVQARTTVPVTCTGTPPLRESTVIVDQVSCVEDIAWPTFSWALFQPAQLERVALDAESGELLGSSTMDLGPGIVTRLELPIYLPAPVASVTVVVYVYLEDGETLTSNEMAAECITLHPEPEGEFALAGSLDCLTGPLTFTYTWSTNSWMGAEIHFTVDGRSNGYTWTSRLTHEGSVTIEWQGTEWAWRESRIEQGVEVTAYPYLRGAEWSVTELSPVSIYLPCDLEPVSPTPTETLDEPTVSVAMYNCAGYVYITYASDMDLPVTVTLTGDELIFTDTTVLPASSDGNLAFNFDGAFDFPGKGLVTAWTGTVTWGDGQSASGTISTCGDSVHISNFTVDCLGNVSFDYRVDDYGTPYEPEAWLRIYSPAGDISSPIAWSPITLDGLSGTFAITLSMTEIADDGISAGVSWFTKFGYEMGALSDTVRCDEAVTPVPTDEVTPIPTDEVTPEPTTPVVTETPVTPDPTDEATETAVPTEEATQVPTDIATESPTGEVIPDPTDEVTQVPTDQVTETPEIQDQPIELSFTLCGNADCSPPHNTGADGFTATWEITPNEPVERNSMMRSFMQTQPEPIIVQAVIVGGTASAVTVPLAPGSYSACLQPVLTHPSGATIRLSEGPLCETVVTGDESSTEPVVAAPFVVVVEGVPVVIPGATETPQPTAKVTAPGGTSTSEPTMPQGTTTTTSGGGSSAPGGSSSAANTASSLPTTGSGAIGSHSIIWLLIAAAVLLAASSATVRRR